jgi:hypothetical protein
MKIKTEIFQDNNLISFKIHKDMGLEEFKTVYENTMNQTYYKKRLDVLVDIREAKLDLSTFELNDLAEFICQKRFSIVKNLSMLVASKYSPEKINYLKDLALKKGTEINIISEN